VDARVTKLLVGVLVVGVALLVRVGGATASRAPQPIGVSGSWRLILDDEFNGSSLAGSRFETGWRSGSASNVGITQGVNPREVDCDDPRQVTVAHGELDLTLIAKKETCGGRTHPYASGIVTTDHTFSYTYGFAEARMWLPGGTNTIADWPAFWTDGQHWPRDGEQDILEGIDGVACWHFHDASGAPGSCAYGKTFTGGWHTFGADWEPGSVTYYYDGELVGRITSGITGAPMYLILGLAPGDPVVAPATARVDYVRVWQR
jgi:beta-glucanase (GH16 family)